MAPEDLHDWDPRWDTVPGRWGEGPWSGNGVLGALGYVHPDRPDRLRVETGHATACMARTGLDLADSCRIPVGHLELVFPGPVDAGSARQHLDRGSWIIACEHTAGTTVIEARAQADRDVILITWKGQAEAHFVPAVAIPCHDRSTRTPCPPSYRADAGEVSVVVQPTDPEGAIVTAWCTGNGWLALSIAVGTDPEATRRKAIEQAVRREEDDGNHREWWQRWWARWDLVLDDPQLQANALLQLSKLASATRPDGPVCDLLGPWYRPTRWPFLFQNLNLQTTYPACAPLGLADHANSFTGWLAAAAPSLGTNVPANIAKDAAWVGTTSSRDGRSQWEGCLERGNLLWHLHVWWEIAHHKGDGSDLETEWLPLLIRAIKLYDAILEEGPDGRLHLPPSRSPEYGIVPDATYDLALLEWGLKAALAHAPGHSEADRWRRTQERLISPHVDPKTGLMVGAGQPFADSHRHHSHLFHYHPLRLRRPDGLFRKSLEHWLSLDRHLAGYSFQLAASCWALLGEGEKAAASIRTGMDRDFQPNGMYLEPSHPYDRKAPPPGVTQMLSPTIETPFIALRATLDLLVRSDEEIIELFPAVPPAWRHAGFKGLYAWGGVRIDATWADGATTWARFEGTGRIRVRCRWARNPDGPAEPVGSDLLIDLAQGPVELNAGGGGHMPEPAPAPWFGSPRIATLRDELFESNAP